jgi:hypothetical protein
VNPIINDPYSSMGYGNIDPVNTNNQFNYPPSQNNQFNSGCINPLPYNLPPQNYNNQYANNFQPNIPPIQSIYPQ